jgi:hypothetical protein
MNLYGQFEKRPVHPRGVQREAKDYRSGDRYRHGKEEAALTRNDVALRRPCNIHRCHHAAPASRCSSD